MHIVLHSTAEQSTIICCVHTERFVWSTSCGLIWCHIGDSQTPNIRYWIRNRVINELSRVSSLLVSIARDAAAIKWTTGVKLRRKTREGKKQRMTCENFLQGVLAGPPLINTFRDPLVDMSLRDFLKQGFGDRGRSINGMYIGPHLSLMSSWSWVEIIVTAPHIYLPPAHTQRSASIHPHKACHTWQGWLKSR